MKVINQFSLLFFVVIFLTSCKTSINKEIPKVNTEKNNDVLTKSEKKKMLQKISKRVLKSKLTILELEKE